MFQCTIDAGQLVSEVVLFGDELEEPVVAESSDEPDPYSLALQLLAKLPA